MKNLLGAQIKVVPGYKGSASVKLAIQRGEVEGVCGVSLSTIKSQWQDDLRSGAFKLILQLSGQPQPEFKGAPHVDSFPRTDDERQLFELVFGAQALGRIYVSPPEMPVARRDALRAAFTATMKDPQFLADAAKTKIDIAPMTGARSSASLHGCRRCRRRPWRAPSRRCGEIENASQAFDYSTSCIGVGT